MQAYRQALVGLQLAMISPNPGRNPGLHLKDILQKEVPLQPAHFPIKYKKASSSQSLAHLSGWGLICTAAEKRLTWDADTTSNARQAPAELSDILFKSTKHNSTGTQKLRQGECVYKYSELKVCAMVSGTTIKCRARRMLYV